MMAHELLRQAALILPAGRMKNADAGDDAGRIVPLCGPHSSAMGTASFRCVAGAVRHRVATSAGVLATLWHADGVTSACRNFAHSDGQADLRLAA